MYNVSSNGWVDSSLSKTVNAPKGYTVEQVTGKCMNRLYRGGAKGGTVYVDGSRDAQVLSLKAEENRFDDETAEPSLAEVGGGLKRSVPVLVETIADLRSTNVTLRF